MFLLNLVPEVHSTQLELLERRLSEAFPQGSFTLARESNGTALVVLTRWGSAVGKGNYSFHEELLTKQGRDGELSKVLDQYIAAAQGRTGP
jgi:hypothetical protein